jgi:4-hydroxy-2-oxoheptanedioate aldolase
MSTFKHSPNRILEAHRKGEVAFGLFLQSHSKEVIEVAAYAGYDFCLIEHEHCRTNLETMLDMVRTCDAAGITPIVRVDELNRAKIRAAVESGACGIMVPHIMSPEDARAAINACHYPPEGDCGICAVIRSARYDNSTYDEYIDWVNKNVSTHLLLEDVSAIEQAEAILDELTPGRDTIHIGLGDIAGAIAKRGEPINWNPEYCTQAAEKVIKLAKERGIHIGGMGWPPTASNYEGAKNAIEQGKSMILSTPDIEMYYSMFKQYINDVAPLKKAKIK